jgi:hypothetical protein
MHPIIREQILKEAELYISVSTFQLVEGRNYFYGLGWRGRDKIGSWAVYDKTMKQVRQWNKLTSQRLLKIIYEDTQTRGFLKKGTFSFGNWYFREKHTLSCWGVGRNGVLFHSLWLLTGVCVLEWSAHLPIKANQEAIKNDWIAYNKYKLQNGCW